ncbi:MAG: outer membrane beta-barrel protein [Rhizobacter sp.]|nr:outer membrane beta-barrel protein [Ferruginibacter sp.]
MKISGICILLFLGNFSANSQAVQKNKIKIGAGISLALPVYNLDISTTGGGVDVLLQYGLSRSVNLTGDVGFTGLPGKGVYPSTAIIPIRLGLRYFPVPKIYIAGKAGLGHYTILKASASYTAYAAGAGYMISKKFDASCYYDGFTNNNSSFGYIAIRAGYQF